MAFKFGNMVDEMIRETLPRTADALKQEKLKTNNNKQVFNFFLKEFKIYRKIAKIEQRVNIYPSNQFPLASSTFNNLHNGNTRNKTRKLILAHCC